MYNGNITDIAGITAAHVSDFTARTGCTIVLAQEGAVGAVDVRGGAPGTRETDAFSPVNMVPQVHGVLLCGGSAFGLAAADGAMAELEQKGIGLDVGVAKVPILGAAVLFDLGVGDPNVRPTAQMGARAVWEANRAPLSQGAVGAGTGATVGKLFGPQFASPSGVGTASMRAGKATIAAVFAVNAVGQVYNHHTGARIQGARDERGQLIDARDLLMPLSMTNTTIGVIATDAVLTKAQAHRLAMLAHDGMAMSIRPVHTMNDGDTAFALATCKVEENPDLLFALAAEVTARAVENAVLSVIGNHA